MQFFKVYVKPLRMKKKNASWQIFKDYDFYFDDHNLCWNAQSINTTDAFK